MKFQTLIGNRWLTLRSRSLCHRFLVESKTLLRLSQQLTSIRKIRRGQSYLIFRSMIFFISRFVFHGTRSEFHSRVPLICICSMDTFGYMGRSLKQRCKKRSWISWLQSSDNRNEITRVISRQTGLMAHKQGAATVHWFAVSIESDGRKVFHEKLLGSFFNLVERCYD